MFESKELKLVEKRQFDIYEGLFDSLEEVEAKREAAVRRLENIIAELPETKDSTKYMMDIIDKELEERMV